MELMRIFMKLRMLSNMALRSLGYRFMHMLRMQLKLGILRKMKMIIFKTDNVEDAAKHGIETIGMEICVLRMHLKMELIRKLLKMMMLSMLPNMALRRLVWRFVCMLRI